jgi:hypothetical protein
MSDGTSGLRRILFGIRHLGLLRLQQPDDTRVRFT